LGYRLCLKGVNFRLAKLNMKGAKDFAKAVPSLMEKIGVIGKPEVWFSEDVEQVTYS